MRTARLLALFVLLVSPSLGGCVVWEIRDEMRHVNASLADVKLTLEVANQALDDVNDRLDKVDQGLSRIDDTNTSLTDVQDRLSLLRSVDASLSRLDTHLASLRKTISRIDSAIPFLSLGGDEEIEVAESEPAQPGEAPVAVAGTDASAPKPEAETKAAQPARRDPLEGTWVSVYPISTRALLLQDEGRYTQIDTDAAGVATRLTGRWTREGTTLTLVSDPRAPTPAKGKQPGPPVSTTQTYDISSLTIRSVTLDSPSGLMIFSKY